MGLDIEQYRKRKIAYVKLNSPQNANAFGPEDMSLLGEAITQTSREPGVRVLVLTGAGQVFSAGASLGDLESVDARQMAEIVARQTSTLFEALDGCAVPTIAALNGPAVGAAAGIALFADLILACHTAKLIFPFASLGLVPDTGLTKTLRNAVGTVRSRALLMTGGTLSANDCFALGLYYRIFDEKEFEAGVQNVAESLADMPLGIHADIREALNGANMSLGSSLEREAKLQARRLKHDETKSAIVNALRGHRGES